MLQRTSTGYFTTVYTNKMSDEELAKAPSKIHIITDDPITPEMLDQFPGRTITSEKPSPVPVVDSDGFLRVGQNKSLQVLCYPLHELAANYPVEQWSSAESVGAMTAIGQAIWDNTRKEAATGKWCPLPPELIEMWPVPLRPTVERIVEFLPERMKLMFPDYALEYLPYYRRLCPLELPKPWSFPDETEFLDYQFDDGGANSKRIAKLVDSFEELNQRLYRKTSREYLELARLQDELIDEFVTSLDEAAMTKKTLDSIRICAHYYLGFLLDVKTAGFAVGYELQCIHEFLLVWLFRKCELSPTEHAHAGLALILFARFITANGYPKFLKHSIDANVGSLRVEFASTIVRYYGEPEDHAGMTIDDIREDVEWLGLPCAIDNLTRLAVHGDPDLHVMATQLGIYFGVRQFRQFYYRELKSRREKNQDLLAGFADGPGFSKPRAKR